MAGRVELSVPATPGKPLKGAADAEQGFEVSESHLVFAG